MLQPPNRRRIYLLRHAEAAYINQDGSATSDERQVSLTPLGREQAHKQAAALADIPFDRALCSGLPRTRETAALILNGRDTPKLEVAPALEEVRPSREVAPADGVEAWLKRIANPWAEAGQAGARFLGGERFADFDARVRPAFDRIVQADDWTQLLLVLHGAVNRSILNHVLNLPWQANVSIEQDNCCINVIDVDKDEDGQVCRYLLRATNLTAYNLNKSGMVLTNMEQAAMQVSELLSAADQGARGRTTPGD